MKKTILFLAIIVLPIGLVAQIPFSDPITSINGFDEALGSSIAVTIGNDGVVERVSFTGVEVSGFPNTIPIGEDFINDGNANFTSGNLPLNPNIGDNVYADFDNDGDLDYLDFGSTTGQPEDVQVTLIKKTGSEWETMTSHGLPELNRGLLIVDDLDNDGLLDVFVSGYTGSSGYTAWFHNNGNFTFNLVQTFPGLSVASGDIGDVDWDGDKDIIYSGDFNMAVRMYLLRKNGTTFTVEDISSGQGFIPILGGSIAFGDKNGDGNIDYFVSSGSLGNAEGFVAQFKKADGDGLFDTPLTPPFEPIYNPSLKFTDTNNDGKIELFAAGWESYGPAVANLFQNNTADNFDLEASFDGFSNGDVVIEDFNGDGFKDVLYAGEVAPYVPILRLYLNETLGVDDYSKESFIVAPNPVKDVLNLKVPQSVQIGILQIIDITGKILLEKETVNTINLSELSQGIYFVKVATNKGTQTKRIVKE